MRARVALALAVFGCAPRADLALPEAPSGARAVVLIASDKAAGVLAPLPIDRERVLVGQGVEAHFFGDGLPDDLPPELTIVDAPACAERGLRAPISSWRLSEDGAREAPARHFAAPSVSVRDVGEVAVASLPTPSPCANPGHRVVDAVIELDLSACSVAGTSRWPVEIDGAICGPAAGDAVCEPTSLEGLDAERVIAAGTCGGEPFAVYRRRAPSFDPLRIDVGPELEARGLSHLNLSDALVWSNRMVVAASPSLGCEVNVGGSVILDYDRTRAVFTSTRAGPPCLGALVPAEDGGFFGALRVGTEPTQLGVGRFARSGAMTASASFDAPALFREPGLSSHRVIALVAAPSATTVTELLLVLLADRAGERADDVFVIVSFDPLTLTVNEVIADKGTPRAAAYDEEDNALVVSDDYANAARYFPLPLRASNLELIGLDLGPGVATGAVLLAPDQRRWLVGLMPHVPGVGVFTRRGTTATTRVVFVEHPLSHALGLVRVGPTRAVGLFLEHFDILKPADTPLWATLFDFVEPEAMTIGADAVQIGRGHAGQPRLGGDGRVWLTLPFERRVVGLRVP